MITLHKITHVQSMAKIEHACYILGKQAAFAISTFIYIPYDNDMMGVSDTCSIILQLLISEQLIHSSFYH